LFTSAIDQAIYIIAIEKNMDKDKIARAKKPWIYVEKLHAELNRIRAVTMSTLADNYFALHVNNDIVSEPLKVALYLHLLAGSSDGKQKEDGIYCDTDEIQFWLFNLV
jgi:hypothetical protein